MKAGTCRICGCQEQSACVGGCEWTDDTRTKCSVCEVRIGAAQIFLSVLGKVNPAAAVDWGLLSARDQQALAMAAGAVMELGLSAQGEGLETVVLEVRDLMNALADTYPAVIDALDQQPRSLKDIVLGLLEGHGQLVLTDR
jgi:hypothetical protein